MTMAEPVDVSRPLNVTEIVMPIDFTEHSWRILRLAQSLAKSVAAEVRFLHVDTASPWRAEDAHPLRVAATPYGEHVDVDVDVIADADPVTGILRYLGPRTGALVALSTQGRGPAGHVLPGHVFEPVVRSSRGAVLAVGPDFDADAHADVSRVVGCVHSAADAVVIVPEALAWARALKVPLDVVTVNPAEPAWRDRAEDVVEAVVKSVQPTYPLVTGTVLVGSHPADVIVDYASTTAGILLALTTHARPMPERAVAGSVTAHVLRHATTGVLLRRLPD